MRSQVRHGENEATHDQVERRVVPQVAHRSSVRQQWYHDKVHQGRHHKGDPGCAQQEIPANVHAQLGIVAHGQNSQEGMGENLQGADQLHVLEADHLVAPLVLEGDFVPFVLAPKDVLDLGTSSAWALRLAAWIE